MADSAGKFTAEEREAMKERAREAKLEEKRQNGENLKAADLADVLAVIGKMAPPDQVIAQKVHELVLEIAPDLYVKTWYGMQAYAKDGKTVIFFQDAQKFKTRYCTLGFSDSANLDDGDLWPTSYALQKLTPEVEKELQTLISKAIK